MSEEEKEAIDILKGISQNDLLNCWSGGEQEYKAIQIGLNLIEKQQKGIREYELTLDILDERKYRKKYLEERRNEQQGLLYPDADEIYERYYQQRKELEKKNKIIDEMAEKIHINDIYDCPNIECEGDGSITCENCIKQYFEKKVEENK